MAAHHHGAEAHAEDAAGGVDERAERQRVAAASPGRPGSAAQRPIAGPSIAETAPPARETAKISGRPPAPVRATAASPAASAACATWAAISSGRAGSRSASAPPQTLSSSVGSRLEQDGEAHRGRRAGLPSGRTS